MVSRKEKSHWYHQKAKSHKTQADGARRRAIQYKNQGLMKMFVLAMATFHNEMRHYRNELRRAEWLVQE